jgi:hypothetical protein
MSLTVPQYEGVLTCDICLPPFSNLKIYNWRIRVSSLVNMYHNIATFNDKKAFSKNNTSISYNNKTTNNNFKLNKICKTQVS